MSKYCSEHPILCEFRHKSGICLKLTEHDSCEKSKIKIRKHDRFGRRVEIWTNC